LLSTSFPAPPGVGRAEDPRHPGRAPPSIGVSAAQAYQASQGYTASSPASVIFPHRAPPSSGPSGYVSPLTGSSHPSQTQSPPIPLPRTASSRSPPILEQSEPEPPHYMNTMSNLGFDGSGRGPLDDVKGIPRRGITSDMGSLRINTQDHTSELNFRFTLNIGRTSSQPPVHRTPDNRLSVSSMSSMHRRMASDSSLASSGYTVSRNHMA